MHTEPNRPPARRRGHLRCASWCGRGCTQAEYEKACADADALVKTLNETTEMKWKTRVWENLGWHFEAVSTCGRWRVFDGAPGHWMAGVGAPESLRMTWTSEGRKPHTAVRNCRKAAVAHVREQAALLDLEVR